MPFIQKLKRNNENEPFSFKIEFHLGADSNGNAITRKELWTAPEGLSEIKALNSVQQTAVAWEKVLRDMISGF